MPDSPEVQRPKVLVVDDDPLIVTLLGALLRGEGFDALEATGGEQALRLASAEIPDVVLLDIMMPGIDGFEVCRRLQMDPVTENIPVIFLTASMKPEHISRSTEMGAGGYITKPFSPPALVNTLKEVCSLEGESSSVLRHSESERLIMTAQMPREQ
jgi:CheY-like chemotaxis protein